MCINLVLLLLFGASESIIGTEMNNNDCKRREREIQRREKALRDGYGCEAYELKGFIEGRGRDDFNDED